MNVAPRPGEGSAKAAGIAMVLNSFFDFVHWLDPDIRFSNCGTERRRPPPRTPRRGARGTMEEEPPIVAAHRGIVQVPRGD